MEFLFFQIVILIFSVVLHEVSHGVVANALGDPTAKNEGRLTVNPISHIDPFGSVILPLTLLIVSQLSGARGIILGWAKPVPVNPFNLHDQKYGPLKVSVAGPGANLAIAVAFAALLRFFPLAMFPPSFSEAVASIVYLNILLALFNLVPLPPLDGSQILFSFLPRSLDHVKIFLGAYGPFLLLFLIFFFFDVLSFFVRAIFQLFVGF